MVSKGDITELKSLSKPPRAVKEVLDVTGIILGYDVSGDSWKTMKKALADPKFLETLKETKTCSPEASTKAKEALHGMTPDEVSKVSRAAGNLTKWCLNILEQ